MNVFTYSFYSSEVAFEQNRYEKVTKKLKENLSSVTAKLNDANYFSLEKNEKAQNYFDSGDSEKMIRSQFKPKRESLRWSRSNRS
jgi:hypothetical protein